MNRRYQYVLLLFVTFAKAAWSDPAPGIYDLPQVVAVQNRAYQVSKEFTLQAGYLPSDAFNKGYTFGANYTYFFSDYLGWEVVNANYVINSPTGLKSDLLDCCQVQVENVGFDGVLDYMQWYALTSIVYTPMYTKSLLFNKRIVRGEISFVGGGGGAKFRDSGMKPLISLGLYLRFFSSESRSWKFDFRNNIYFEKSLGAVNSMSLSVAYAFHFGAPSNTRPIEDMDEL